MECVDVGGAGREVAPRKAAEEAATAMGAAAEVYEVWAGAGLRGGGRVVVVRDCLCGCVAV